MFNFGISKESAVKTVRPQLKPWNIYDVKFMGCEVREFAGKKDPNASYKVLDIKFENEDGYFTVTKFFPKEGDQVRREVSGANGGKTYVELVCDSKFEKGQVYYIAILPTEFKSITVEFDGFTAKSKEFENPYVISRNKIVDLGIIETSSTGRVIAGLGGVWEVNKGVPFVEGENYYEAKNVTIAATDKFKIVISGTWLTATMKTGEWITLKDGGDATLSAGTYDFYLTKYNLCCFFIFYLRNKL